MAESTSAGTKFSATSRGDPPKEVRIIQPIAAWEKTPAFKRQEKIRLTNMSHDV